MIPEERTRAAATVILHRDGEVYLVERSKAVRFFPGYHAFPGGTLDKEEQARVTSDGIDAFARAALRELEEEVDVQCPPDALVPAGRLITPPFGPVRYDTQFFLAALPDDAECRIVDTGELVSGRWWKPEDALAEFANGRLLVPPPTLALLRRLAAAPTFDAAARALAAEDHLPHHKRFFIEMHPGIHALPLRAPTLPPATTTVTFLVAASGMLVVVDPGTPDEDERRILTESIGMLVDRGHTPLAVVLTHHHRDHHGSASHLKEKFGFAVLAHPETAKRLPEGFVTGLLHESDAIDLGTYAPTGSTWRLDVLHTPGHAPGHIALRDSRFGALIVGDMVSSVSTILVNPDEGDMGDYLRSLERLVALDPPIVLPAHGPAVTGNGLLANTLKHRRERQAKVEAALTKGPRRPEEMVADVYADTPGADLALAASQVLSICLMLEREGKARRDKGGFRLAEGEGSRAT